MRQELQDILKLLGGIEEVLDQLNDRILFDLRNKSIESIRKELQDDPPGVLQYVHYLALQAEQYEICEAVKQIQKTG